MPKQYIVHWSRIAQNDLQIIVDYISQKSSESAEKIFDQIVAKVNSLKLFPYRGRIVPDLKEIKVERYHELMETRWKIIYEIVEIDVFIVSIIDEKRDVKDILLDRLNNNFK